MASEPFCAETFERAKVADALRALAWAVETQGMNVFALRRGINEIDSLTRETSPALETLVHHWRKSKSADADLFQSSKREDLI